MKLLKKAREIESVRHTWAREERKNRAKEYVSADFFLLLSSSSSSTSCVLCSIFPLRAMHGSTEQSLWILIYNYRWVQLINWMARIRHPINCWFTGFLHGAHAAWRAEQKTYLKQKKNVDIRHDGGPAVRHRHKSNRETTPLSLSVSRCTVASFDRERKTYWATTTVLLSRCLVGLLATSSTRLG